MEYPNFLVEKAAIINRNLRVMLNAWLPANLNPNS